MKTCLFKLLQMEDGGQTDGVTQKLRCADASWKEVPTALYDFLNPYLYIISSQANVILKFEIHRH